MKVTTQIFAGLIVIIALVVSGCTQSAPSGPSAGLGSVTVTQYVSIGNSLTAGYQSNGLYQSAQIYSYPNLISQQLVAAGANLKTFNQPIWPDPGNPDPATGKAARLQLISWNGPVIGPAGEAVTAGAPPTAGTLAQPYSNLGIPGAILYDFLDTADFTAKAAARANGFFPAILRSAVFGNSIYAQAKNLNPDIVTFWLGNNDVLGYATSGGTAKNMVGTDGPTPSALFAQMYTTSVGALHASLPSAKILVANIPDVKAVPFFTTMGPEIAASIPAGVYLRYQKHGNSGPAFDSTRLTEANAPLITLKAAAYAGLLGHPTGQWYRDVAASFNPPVPVSAVIGAGIDTTMPFGFHPQNPIPDALVLDADEQATAAQSTSDFNATIASVAAAAGAAVVDMNGFFNSVKASGVNVDGEIFTTEFISGGLFSLDGVHPSSKGYGIVANQYIKTMNSAFGMHVPYVNINSLPGIPIPLGRIAAKRYIATIPYSAWKSFDALWNGGF
ncbi:MAG TPA: SGNH/GDSL hydrolase family protein [Bacteroidota bacterium]|nr:SGNH/GDSL hydrolase family protein [Bacteroidota bacterium]